MSVNLKMTAIADEIRTLSGTSEAMGLDAMANYVNDANTEIESQEDLLTQIASALENKTGNSKTISTTVINNSSNKVYYFNVNGEVQNIPANTTKTVQALQGFFSYNQVSSTNCSGNYVQGNATEFGNIVFIFLSDGGTMHCAPSGLGGVD